MARIKYTWGELDKVAADFGLKMPQEKVDNTDKTAKREKFAKCRACGGQMTYVSGTNAFVCENMVEKEIKKFVDGQEVGKEKKTLRCGNVNLVGEQYQSYMNYLFN